MENRTTRPLKGEGKKCPGPRRGSPSGRGAPFWKSGRTEKKKRKSWSSGSAAAARQFTARIRFQVNRLHGRLPFLLHLTAVALSIPHYGGVVGELVARPVDVNRRFEPESGPKVD